MRLRDRITNGIRAVFHNLLDRDTHVPEEDRLATDIEVAQARLAQQQELWVDTNARQQEAATAWQQAQARVAEVQQRLDAATRAGNSVEAESLQAECTQMQTLAQELGRHVTRLRQSAAELQAEERALQQRIARGRQRLAKLAQEAARAPAAVSAAPAPSAATTAKPAHPPAAVPTTEQAPPPPDLAARIQRLALGEQGEKPPPPASAERSERP